MVRHHFCRPRRRSVQPVEIFLGREYLILLKFVQHEETFRIERTRPSRPPLETGNTHPLWKMLVRMPIAELRALVGGNVPPHGDGCLTQKRHAYLNLSYRDRYYHRHCPAPINSSIASELRLLE